MEQGTRHYNKQHILELIKTANAKHLRVRRTGEAKVRSYWQTIVRKGTKLLQNCIAFFQGKFLATPKEGEEKKRAEGSLFS
jgi:hypothetical protein